MTANQTHVRINSNTLFAVLRVLEEALPLVHQAVEDDDLMDNEERSYWMNDLEDVHLMLKAIDPSHTPRSWLLMPFAERRPPLGVDVHV